MKQYRTASYSTRDKSFASMKNKTISRKLKISNRLRKTHQEATTSNYIHGESNFSDNTEDCIEEKEDSDFDNTIEETSINFPERSHKRVVKTGTTLFVPPDFLKLPGIVSAAVRNKVTPTSLTSMMRAFIEECGGDVNSVNLSYSRCHRNLTDKTQEIAEEIQETWTPPPKGVIQWETYGEIRFKWVV